jgi:hypothetical protein
VTDTSESIKEGTFSVCGKRGMLVSTIATTAIYVVGLASMLVYAFYVSDHSPTLGFNHAVRDCHSDGGDPGAQWITFKRFFPGSLEGIVFFLV